MRILALACLWVAALARDVPTQAASEEHVTILHRKKTIDNAALKADMAADLAMSEAAQEEAEEKKIEASVEGSGLDLGDIDATDAEVSVEPAGPRMPEQGPVMPVIKKDAQAESKEAADAHLKLAIEAEFKQKQEAQQKAVALKAAKLAELEHEKAATLEKMAQERAAKLAKLDEEKAESRRKLAELEKQKAQDEAQLRQAQKLQKQQQAIKKEAEEQQSIKKAPEVASIDGQSVASIDGFVHKAVLKKYGKRFSARALAHAEARMKLLVESRLKREESQADALVKKASDLKLKKTGKQFSDVAKSRLKIAFEKRLHEAIAKRVQQKKSGKQVKEKAVVEEVKQKAAVEEVKQKVVVEKVEEKAVVEQVKEVEATSQKVDDAKHSAAEDPAPPAVDVVKEQAAPPTPDAKVVKTKVQAPTDTSTLVNVNQASLATDVKASDASQDTDEAAQAKGAQDDAQSTDDNQQADSEDKQQAASEDSQRGVSHDSQNDASHDSENDVSEDDSQSSHDSEQDTSGSDSHADDAGMTSDDSEHAEESEQVDDEENRRQQEAADEEEAANEKENAGSDEEAGEELAQDHDEELADSASEKNDDDQDSGEADAEVFLQRARVRQPAWFSTDDADLQPYLHPSSPTPPHVLAVSKSRRHKHLKGRKHVVRHTAAPAPAPAGAPGSAPAPAAAPIDPYDMCKELCKFDTGIDGDPDSCNTDCRVYVDAGGDVKSLKNFVTDETYNEKGGETMEKHFEDKTGESISDCKPSIPFDPYTDFKVVDFNNDGKLTRGEMDTWGMKACVPSHLAQQIFTAADADYNKEVSPEEYNALGEDTDLESSIDKFADKTSKGEDEYEPVKLPAFRHMDSNSDGQLDSEEIMKIFKQEISRRIPTMSEADVNALAAEHQQELLKDMKSVDKNADGVVNEEEYAGWNPEGMGKELSEAATDDHSLPDPDDLPRAPVEPKAAGAPSPAAAAASPASAAAFLSRQQPEEPEDLN